MRTRVCVISFSPIHQDARVLRQIEYLSREYEITVIGYGTAAGDSGKVQWLPVQVRSNRITRLSGGLLMLLGRILPRLYEVWYWSKEHHRSALRKAIESHAAVYHANDWNALPISEEAARRASGRVVFDAHEYSPLEYENRLSWRVLYAPLVLYILRRYGRHIAASTTVAPAIAERYKEVFGFEPIVVLNAPKSAALPQRSLDPAHTGLVHHGGANVDRHLELMIQTMAFTDPRYSLHLYLVGGPPGYVEELKLLADRVAPGKVHFHEPIPPREIVQRIAAYDIGIFLLEPNNYNYRVALPNKLFDFLAAGLAVCIGPSPGMAAFVHEHECGWIAPTFAPADVASMLNNLTATEIESMRASARQVGALFTADTEMEKVLHIYHRILGEGPK